AFRQSLGSRHLGHDRSGALATVQELQAQVHADAGGVRQNDFQFVRGDFGNVSDVGKGRKVAGFVLERRYDPRFAGNSVKHAYSVSEKALQMTLPPVMEP